MNIPPPNFCKPSEYTPPLAASATSEEHNYWYTEAGKSTVFVEGSWALVNCRPASRSFNLEKQKNAKRHTGRGVGGGGGGGGRGGGGGGELSRDCRVNAPPSLNRVKWQSRICPGFGYIFFRDSR